MQIVVISILGGAFVPATPESCFHVGTAFHIASLQTWVTRKGSSPLHLSRIECGKAISVLGDLSPTNHDMPDDLDLGYSPAFLAATDFIKDRKFGAPGGWGPGRLGVGVRSSSVSDTILGEINSLVTCFCSRHH